MTTKFHGSRSVALLALASFAAGFAPAQQRDFSKVEITAERVTDHIYVLFGSGGNIGVSVGDDGLAIIDDQFAPLTPKIRAALADLSPKPVKFVVNTHWHGDHTGGNEEFGKTGSIIVAQGNVRQRMSSEQFSQMLNQSFPAAPAAALPVITFDDSVTLHWNGDDLEIIHLPRAHTDGDAIVRWSMANVVHLGDLMMQTSYPFIDIESGGSIQGLIAALTRLEALTDEKTRIIPGHGKVFGKPELVAYRSMLETVRDRVDAAIQAGKSLEEVIAMQPSQEFDGRYANAFIKPETIVTAIYKGLSGH